MKIQDIRLLALLNDGEPRTITTDIGLVAEIDFGGFGFESTEYDNGDFSGWKFYGESTMMQTVTHVFNALTEEAIEYPLLTTELATKNIGNILRCEYHDTNDGVIVFKINGIVEQPSKSIGQASEYRLQVTEYHKLSKIEWINMIKPRISQEKYETMMQEAEKQEEYAEDHAYFYEWQGIFRRGSGAERLIVKEVSRETEH